MTKGAVRRPEYYFRNMEEFPLKEIFRSDKVWDTLKNKNKVLQEKVNDLTVKSKRIESNVKIEGPVYIGENTRIESYSVIKADEENPIYIGDNCSIGPHAYIRKGTVIGNGVEIGRTEIKGSVIMNGVNSHHHGYIGDSIIGSNVNIATSFDSGNLKHTYGTIKIDGEDTELKKMGCVIGDYSKTGCKTTTAPGTLIGPNVWLDEGLVVSGFIPENTFRRRVRRKVDEISYQEFIEDIELLEKYRR